MKGSSKGSSLIGQKLANFQIKRLLGRGGMAEVYYGWDVKLQRPVAVKIIESSPSHAHRFVREARMMAKWRHENIVQIYYADDTNRLYYYVMEYIDGKDLASVLSTYAKDGELMPVKDVLRIARSVAHALDYAHKHGVIHRDVKPANILLADNGRVVLGDFGLALDLQDKSQGEAFGTPHYISPEQARRSADAVPQSDLYSLGVILYEMLTGIVPFNDPSPASLALQHITQLPPPPRTINPDLSLEVEAVLLKALEKKPKDRYQNGEKLLYALEKALTVAPKPVKVKLSMPPIPVSAPTIRRSEVALDEYKKRKEQKPERSVKPIPSQKPATPSNKKPASRKGLDPEFSWMLSSILFIVVLVLALGWLINRTFFSKNTSPTPVPPTAGITATAQLVVVPPATFTNTAISDLTATPIAIISSQTSTNPLPIMTATKSLPTPTSIPTETPAIIVPTPTINYPNGLPFILYYNESSFYLYNNSAEIRSLSGFSFERVNNDGTFQDRFEGWQWEVYFADSQPDRCVRLEIYQSKVTYLNPVICKNRYHSTLQPNKDSQSLFWIPKENSHQFRVLWQEEEIARCEIAVGLCEVLVP